MNPSDTQTDFGQQLSPQAAVDTPEIIFDLQLEDPELLRLTANQLQADIDHWEQGPWLLSLTDKENINYLLGMQRDAQVANPNTQTPYVDNRLFTSMRAMLAYATGQTAKPELLPSSSTDSAKHVARHTAMGLYQHALDHEVNGEMRLALKNLIHRKRGFIKLRYDDDCGPFGDIETKNIDPADVVVGRFARYQANPDRIWHRQTATIQALCDLFPDKKAAIMAAFGFQRGVYTQMSRVITYWECWFTYWDQSGEAAEGLCWLLPEQKLVLGKMANPNWLKQGSPKQERLANVTTHPIKPFLIFNYWNTGRSALDETCLFDQARPLQDILNKRGRQIVENADYANPRILANGQLFDEADANKFVNKNPKTIGLLNNLAVDADINKAVLVINPSSLPSYVIQDKFDARSEIDAMMGTPSQFRGQQSQSANPTLGQDLLIREQSSALQDDLVNVVNAAWRQYYLYLLQMMTVYLPDDYYVMVQGQDGEYDHIMLSQDSIDSNVRVTVRVDSTLPLNKEAQRATAMQLAQQNKIDPLSLYELLGMPEPEKLVERLLRFQLDPINYIASVSSEIMSQEAETDLRLLINGKQPAERDDYAEDYLNHFNAFIVRNEFRLLPADAQHRITAHLDTVANTAATTEALKDSTLDPAGMLERPLTPPMPKRQIRYMANLTPEETAQSLGMPATGMGGAPAPGTATASGAPGPGQPSPPRLVNPSQFGTK